MSKPFFSIVIPVYNRGELMRNRLKDIFRQSFTSFEVIVIDDGSSENIQEILSTSFSDEPRLRIIRQNNLERGAARNNGFKNANGEYVVFFDSDDIMHENHLQVLHDFIDKKQSPDFLATYFNFIDEIGKISGSDIMNLKEGFYDYQLFLSGNPLACNICVKKDNPSLLFFEEDRKYAIKEDWMFMLANMKLSKLYIIPITTISMFDHSDRSMRSDNKLIIEKTHLAVDWILTHLDLSESEIKQLHAHENYFCGIHWYLEFNRHEAVKAAWNAIGEGGIKTKYLSLLMKSMIGRKLISRIK